MVSIDNVCIECSKNILVVDWSEERLQAMLLGFFKYDRIYSFTIYSILWQLTVAK